MEFVKESSFKLKIILLSVAAIVVAALLTVAAKFDLEISRFLYDEKNLFSVIFEVIGKAPAYILLAFSFCILYQYRNVEGKNIKIISTVFYLAAIFASFVLLIYEMSENAEGKIKILLSLGIAPALTLFSVWITGNIKKCNIKKLVKFAFSTIIIIVSVILLTLIFKAVWGRLRFFEIYNEQEKFMPWYRFQRLGGSSMPSGHVALGTCIFCLTSICDCFKCIKGKKYIFYILSFTYVILVALSRIAAGAHYFSDTIVAFTISFFVYEGIDFVMFGKYSDKIYFSDEEFYKLLLLRK